MYCLSIFCQIKPHNLLKEYHVLKTRIKKKSPMRLKHMSLSAFNKPGSLLKNLDGMTEIQIAHIKPFNTNQSETYVLGWLIGWLGFMAVRVFANGPGDLGSIPGRVIPKTLKMELDTTLLNTQHYKVQFKGKVEQSREWSSALPYTLV